MSSFFGGWPAFALGSAFFADLVGLFGKLGVQGIPPISPRSSARW